MGGDSTNTRRPVWEQLQASGAFLSKPGALFRLGRWLLFAGYLIVLMGSLLPGPTWWQRCASIVAVLILLPSVVAAARYEAGLISGRGRNGR